MKGKNSWLKRILLFDVLVHPFLFFAMFRKPDKRWKRGHYDCAVVCGYFANEDGTASELMKTRVEKAAALWKEGKVSCLIFSGAAVYNSYVEAEVMRDYAVSLGVGLEYIFEEKQAISTYHNMLHSKAIMREQGFENCVVVTNGWHLRKADHYARKLKLDYVMAQAENPKGESMWDTFRRYIKTNWKMYREMYKGYW